MKTPLLTVAFGLLLAASAAAQTQLQDQVPEPEPEPNSVPNEAVAPPDPDPTTYIEYEEWAAPLNLSEVRQSIGYPNEAKEVGLEGKVVLRILIGTDGSYIRHIVLKDPHPMLTHAVVAHVKEIKFRPSKLHGKAVKSWVVLPIQFKIDPPAPAR